MKKNPVMLKRVLASLVLTISLPYPLLADGKTVGLSTELPCLNLKELTEILNKHGEEAMFTAVGHREIDGEIKAFPVVFFVNTKTKTWTIMEKYSNDVYCASAMGQDIKPYLGESKDKIH
jgi:hypothetical protein